MVVFTQLHLQERHKSEVGNWQQSSDENMITRGSRKHNRGMHNLFPESLETPIFS